MDHLKRLVALNAPAGLVTHAKRIAALAEEAKEWWTKAENTRDESLYKKQETCMTDADYWASQGGFTLDWSGTFYPDAVFPDGARFRFTDYVHIHEGKPCTPS